MPIRLVNEEKGSYHLTDDVFDFLYRSKEIESELDYSVTRFKMQEYMKRKNYSEALSQSRELVARLRNMSHSMDDFIMRCRENIAKITVDEYERIVGQFRNLMYDEQKELEEMTMKELRAQIEIMKTQYVNTSAIEAELYQRVTVPLASLIFALVGVPLGLQPTRNSSSAGFAMSVIIIFVYYALMTMGSALARSEALPPLLAVWLPNIIGLISGGLLIRRAAR
jgi:lipopolysaccharide export LptBFGC system permease protein LptF